jgi:hypothetical protein
MRPRRRPGFRAASGAATVFKRKLSYPVFFKQMLPENQNLRYAVAMMANNLWATQAPILRRPAQTEHIRYDLYCPSAAKKEKMALGVSTTH